MMTGAPHLARPRRRTRVRPSVRRARWPRLIKAAYPLRSTEETCRTRWSPPGGKIATGAKEAEGTGEAAKETLSLSDWKHMCVSTEREWEREGATKSDGTKFKGKLVLSFCSRCPRGGGFPRLFSWLSSTN